MVDRYEHTYQAVNIINMKDGEIMFVLKAMRVAAATLIKILFKKIKLSFFREKIFLPTYKKLDPPSIF
jgi:hypothetical protein